MPTVQSKQRRANTNIIENQALVASRLRRWQDGDIGTGSMENYVPKQKEFIEWCKKNRPGVLNNDRRMIYVIFYLYCVCKNHKSWLCTYEYFCILLLF